MGTELRNRIRAWLESNVLAGTAIAFVVGLVVGWLALGWWLFPVRWVNAPPADLQPNYKEHYVAMVADSYALNGNLKWAKARVATFQEEELAQIMGKLVSDYTVSNQPMEAQRVQTLARALGVTLVAVGTPVAVAPQPTATPQPLATRPPAPGQAPSLGQRLRFIGGIFLLSLLIVVGGILAFVWLTRTREARSKEAGGPRWRGGGQVVLGHPVTAAYSLGDEGYRESFLIYDEVGELLGECGLRISEVISKEEPTRVAAFNVWLFDKREVRTVTKVLASEHVYEDEAMRARLEPTGEVVLAERGRIIPLETAWLRLEAEVVDFAYGINGSVPAHSYFDRLTVELTPMRREAASEEDQPLPEPRNPRC